MILASGTMAGDRMLFVGLSHENLARLVAGQPIVRDLAELPGGWRGRLVIVTGDTEEAIAEMLPA